ncbi:MAG TPA: hypothetical protein VI075_01685, partial [Methyloceanibacter sp.]
ILRFATRHPPGRRTHVFALPTVSKQGDAKVSIRATHQETVPAMFCKSVIATFEPWWAGLRANRGTCTAADRHAGCRDPGEQSREEEVASRS